MIRDTLLTACLLFLTVFSFAQPICPNPNPDGATACFGACIDCNIGQFSGNNYAQGTPQTLLVCGGAVTMHSPKWHAFIAGTPTVSFTISPSDCQGLEGLVAVITDFCDVDRTLACYEGRPFGSQWPAVVTASGLQVGNVYQLGIGGKDGTTCQYTIDVTDGVAAPPPVGPISLIDGPTQVCPNAVAVYSISAASNALTYRWQAPPGASINGQGNIVNLTPSVGTQVTVTFGQVGGNICVRASNQCSVSPTQCLQVVNTPIPVTQLSDIKLCYNELPYIWEHPPFFSVEAPGTWVLVSEPYGSYLGCDSIVRQRVIVTPPKIVTLPPRYLCATECFTVAGNTYCDAGNYSVQTTAANGCDSTINFSIVKVLVDAQAQVAGQLNCVSTAIQLTSNGSSSGQGISYNWFNGSLVPIGNTPTISVSATGNYYLVVSNSQNGKTCRDTAAVFVNANNQVPLASAGPTKTLNCLVNQVQLSGTGSTGPQFGYNWSASGGGNIMNDINTLTPTVNAAGTYTLTVTNNATGCTSTSVTTVVNDNQPPGATAAGGTFTCTTPSVTLQATTAATTANYLWSGPGGFVSTAQNPTVNVAGTYSVTITNPGNGCTSVATTSVVADNLPPGAAAAASTLTCSESVATLTGTSPGTNVGFAWSGPNGFSSNQAVTTTNTAGIYTLTATGANGCVSTASTTVNSDTQAPGAAAAGGTLTCATASLAINGSSATPGVNYAWAGPNGFTSGQQSPTVNAPGDYVLTVTGPNGCTSVATTNVGQDLAAPSATVEASGFLNCNNLSVNLVATPAGGTTYNFNWQNPDGSTTSTGQAPLLSASAPGQYILTLTNNGNGCTGTANVTVERRLPVAVTSFAATPVNCFGEQNGSLTAFGGGGDGNFIYEWSTGDNTASIGNLTAGEYFVTVTDGENCTATASSTVAQPAQLDANASATGETGNASNDGTATANPIGGTSPYEFEWENGQTTPSITGLAPGSYNVTVTDDNGCTSVQTVTVNQFNCNVQADIVAQNVLCNGANNGTASVNLTGAADPITYNWSTGATTPSVSGLAPGQYSVSLSDSKNCPAELTFEIIEPTPLSVNATSTNASGVNQNDGTASANPTGGTPTYTYNWQNGQTTESITGLAPGSYTVTVTDGNGCTEAQTIEVGLDNCGLAGNFVEQAPTCNGLPNGVLTFVPVGGTPPFDYAWSNGGDTEVITNLPAGSYTLTVTDDVGCQVAFQFDLPQPSAVSIELVSTTNTPCANAPQGSATVTASGGTGTLDIAWSNGQTGPTAVNLVAGAYTVAATDDNGCEVSSVVNIAAEDTELPSVVATPAVLPLGPAGEIVLDLQNTGALVSDNCQVTDVVFSPGVFDCTDQGEHVVTVTATDGAGNSSSAQVTYTIVDNAAPEMECPDDIVRCFGDNVVQYPAPSAEDNCSNFGGQFSLDAGLLSGSQFPLGSTVNTYSFTDAGGNVGSCSFNVTILTQLVATATAVNEIENQMNGAINLTPSGSLPPYTYQWTFNGAPFATTQNISNLSAGTYAVTITDANGCTFVLPSTTILSVVGTGEPSWAFGFSLQPNPTSGALWASFPSDLTSDVQFIVTDALGRRVYNQLSRTGNRVDLDLTTLPDGLYSVQVRIGSEALTRKIVIARD